MKLKLKDVGTMQKILNTLNKFVTEAMFRASKDGLKCRMNDPTMVATISCTIPDTSEIFSDYSMTATQDFKVNIDVLSKILGRAGKDDMVELETTDTTLDVTIVGTRKKEFKIPLIDIGEEDIVMFDTELKLEYEGKVVMAKEVLVDMLDDVSIVADVVIIKVSPTSVNFEAGDQITECTTEILSTSECIDNIEYKKSFQSKMSTDYLAKFKEALKMSDKFTMENGQDYPLRLQVNLPSVADLQVTIAPRVDD